MRFGGTGGSSGRARRAGVVMVLVGALAVIANVLVAPSPASAGRQASVSPLETASRAVSAAKQRISPGAPVAVESRGSLTAEAAPVLEATTSSSSTSSTSSSSTSSSSTSSTSSSTSTTTVSTTTAAPVTTIAPVAGASSFTDATGDNPPGLDPHGDLTTVGDTYTATVSLTAAVKSPIDPATDPNWKDFVTGVAWLIDAGQDDKIDFVLPYVAPVTGVPAAILLDSNFNVVNCDVAARFANGAYSAEFAPSCIGTPHSFQMQAGFIYRTATVDSFDVAPEGAPCCAVTQSLPVATTVAAPAPSAGTLARTGMSPLIQWHLVIAIICLFVGCNFVAVSAMGRPRDHVRRPPLPPPPPGTARLLRGADRR